MRIFEIKALHLVSLGLLASLHLAACNKGSNVSEAELLARAKTHHAQGNTRSQIIELKNLLQKNPNHPEAHWLLGETYANLGYGKDAEKELLRAQELGVDKEKITVLLGKSLLDQREYKRVLNEIRPVIASSATTVAGIKTLYAQAHLGLKEFEKGCELFREAKQTDNQYVPAYWGISQCSLGFGKPIEAADELDSALKIDEKNVETWLLRGDLWRSQKQLVEAEKAYTAGLSHRPDHLSLLLARASVRVPLNNHTGAMEDLNQADKQNKDHPLALHLKGVMQYKDKKYADAKVSFETVLKINPDYLPTVLWMAMTDYALNNLEQASHGFAKYVGAVPNATEVQAFLAMTRVRLGGKKGAAEVLRALDKVDINDPQTLVLIGQAHLLTGDEKASARYLTRAIEKQPDAIDPRVNLVAALLQQGDKPGALHQAEELFKKSPNDTRAASLLIGALLKNGEIDRALDVVRQLEQKMPNSPIPHIYRAAIKTEKHDIDGAKIDLEKADKMQPGSPLIGHSLAAIAIQRGQLDSARRYYEQVKEKNGPSLATLMALYDLEVLAKQPGAARKRVEEAANKYPNAARPAAVIATAYVRSGQPEKALELSAQAAAANPNDVDLLTARGGAFYNKGDLTAALDQFARIVKLRPDLPEGHFKVALVHNDKGDFISLRNDLKQVLKLDMKHARAKLMLATLNLQDKKFDEALSLASAVQKDDPAIAEAYVLESSALVMLKREAEAFAVLERALKAVPNSDLPAIEIAKLRFNAGQPEAGFKAINTWLAAHPDNIRGTAFLAESLMANNKEADAVKAYEKILKLEPENPIALNNLASIFTTSDPARGLDFAERAHKRAPDDVSVMDTLGWSLLKNGQSKRALELIERAFQSAPNAAEIHFHFAAALAENGEKAKAKRELEKLLGRPGNFSIKQEAKALLATL